MKLTRYAPVVRPNRFDRWPCPIARSADLLGDPWIPMVLRECTYGVSRFNDLQQRLSIARNILTARLERMVEQGLLEKRAYDDHPPRYEYALTEKGLDATLILAAMMRFGDDWIFAKGKSPIVLRDRETGRLVKPRVVDERTGEPIDPAAVVPAAGPGFPGDAAFRRAWFEPGREASDG